MMESPSWLFERLDIVLAGVYALDDPISSGQMINLDRDEYIALFASRSNTLSQKFVMWDRLRVRHLALSSISQISHVAIISTARPGNSKVSITSTLIAQQLLEKDSGDKPVDAEDGRTTIDATMNGFIADSCFSALAGRSAMATIAVCDADSIAILVDIAVILRFSRTHNGYGYQSIYF